MLRYDRRPSIDGRDVPLADQAADARAAMARLRREIDGPVVLWGLSKARGRPRSRLADEPEIALVITVDATVVSPDEQMRYGT